MLSCWLWIIASVLYLAILAYHRATLMIWSIAVFIGLVIVSELSPFSYTSLTIFWVLWIILALFNLTAWRRKFISHYLLAHYRKVMPKISATEREALAAGTVQWAAELFSGMPNWEGMLAKRGFQLSPEEQAFLDGPVEELCCMINDWDITHNRADLPPKLWQFLKKQGFFGLIIPKKYGGKAFSAAAHSAIITKVGACSVTVASTIAVPNSLGPAELIADYGTDKQRKFYLPRLAQGKEIPCFALSGPEVGSDATSMPDNGIICKGPFEGKKIIGIRLNFNKRYITLAPIATVIALAVKLYDPDHLLGTVEDRGITCILLPRDLAGISIGRRHFPLNVPFQNGPIQGKNVFVPLDWVIGGTKMVGQGWRMLVECLSVGRGITLPSMAAGGCKAGALMTGAYARIRHQFNVPIGHFEGVEEALARIAANTYIIEAAKEMTVAAIDRGEKPAVLTAIVKYHATNRGRQVANDIMDIHGGKGICLGPNNYTARHYQSIPISITVEGANILTRSMIIFGQGAIRCHPYVLTEMNAVLENQQGEILEKFDKALFAHLGFLISNATRSFLLGLTHAWVVVLPRSPSRRYLRQLTRFSSVFALLADMAMLTMGSDLKRKEKLSARLGDILSDLYLASAVIKRFHVQGQAHIDLPLLHWASQHLLADIQARIDGVLQNFPQRWLARCLRILIFPWGRRLRQPSDRLGHRVASLLLYPNEARARLGQGLCFAKDAPLPLGRAEALLREIIAAEPLEKKIRRAQRKGEIHGYDYAALIDAAQKAKILTPKEAKQLHEIDHARQQLIAVDDFDSKDLARGA